MELLLLLIAVVLAVAVGTAAVAFGTEYRRVHSAGAGRQGDHHGGGLGTYELAYLSGGPRRVINTALALLIRAGSVRVARSGRVSLVSGAPQSFEPVEQAVLDALGSLGGSRQAEEARRTVADGRAVSGLRHRLLGMGLLVPDGAFTEARRLHDRLLVVTVLTIVFEIGVVLDGGSWGTRLVAGVASIGGLITYLGWKRALRGVVTRAGHEALASARSVHPRGARPAEAGLVLAVGIPVALYGLSELGDPLLEEELNRQVQSQGAAGDSGCAGGACGGSAGSSDGVSYGGDSGGGWGGGDSGGDSGGGSSCGGGSGCGGGCGGG